MKVILRLKMTKEVGRANVECVKVKVGGVKVKVGGVELMWKVLWLLLMEQRAIGNGTSPGVVLMASDSQQ